MDIVHVKCVFEDVFSFAKSATITTHSQDTFEVMKKSIGQVVIDKFDKANQIHWTLKLIECKQASVEDYSDPILKNSKK